MRTFNDRGNTADIQNFYKRKLDDISKLSNYAETNHTLAKCGLVENIVKHPIAQKSCLIILRRNFIKQCASYLTRGDFDNLTTIWQWYLSPLYANNIVDFAPFKSFGKIGMALWYTCEMDARQHYYASLFSDRIRIISINLEEVTTNTGASQFLKSIGIDQTHHLPEPVNQNSSRADSQIYQRVKQMWVNIDYDPELIVQNYVSSDRMLDQLVAC